MKNYKLILLLFFSLKSILGQNLVPNPSFENLNSSLCSISGTRNDFNNVIQDWTVPTLGTSDIFSTTISNLCTANANSFINGVGNQTPRTGNHMAGFISYGINDYREYLQVPLIESLIPGETYEVEFWVSNAEKFPKQTNNIGAAFSDNLIDNNLMTPLNLTPEVNETSVVTDSDNWQKISGTFVASSVADFMIIGNFFSNDLTTTVTKRVTTWQSAYYFIDDVSVVRVKKEPCEKSLFGVFTGMQNICEGDTGLFEIRFFGAPPYTMFYQLNGVQQPSITVNDNGPYFMPMTEAGIFKIDSVSYANCMDAKTHGLSGVNAILPLPELDLGEDQTVCSDGSNSLTLDAGNVGSTFLWNTTETTQTINVSSAGNYTVEVTDAKGCSSKDTIIVTETHCICNDNDNDGICDEDHFDKDTVYICEGDSITLNAKNITDQIWSGDEAFIQINDSTIRVSPSDSTFYYVGGEQEYVIIGPNVIVNGDFENGNTSFTSEYIEDCVPGIWPGDYCVTNSPKNVHTGGFVTCGDHSSGTGDMFVANGAFVNGQKVWCQNINVEADTDYEFSAWLTDVNVFGTNPPQLEFQINGGILGSTLTAENGPCKWENYAATWNSGVITNTEICLVNQNLLGEGNDFAIDDISFSPIRYISGSADSILVIVRDSPKFDLGNDTSVCRGDSIEIGSALVGDYLWNNGSTTSHISVLDSGMYWLSITDINGCENSDSIYIRTNLLPNINLGSSPTICDGDSIKLDAQNSGLIFVWNTGANSQSIWVKNAGIYEVEVSTTVGCSSSSRIEVFVNDLPVVNIGLDTTICNGQNITLDAQNIGANYVWNNGETNQTIQISEIGMYYVEVRDNIGCLGTDTILISKEIIENPFLEKQKHICEGDSILLEPDFLSDFNIYWAIDANNSSITVSEEGTYLSIVEGSYCKDTFEIKVNKLDTPRVIITDLYGKGAYCFDYETAIIQLSNDSDDVIFIWDDFGRNDKVEITQPGTYYFTTENENCASQNYITIEDYCNGVIFMPNAFTPGNADGRNDLFKAESNGVIDSYELRIYNRWGQLIFLTNNIKEGWDGTFKGNPVQTDVYVYNLSYSYQSKSGGLEKRHKIGHISLIK